MPYLVFLIFIQVSFRGLDKQGASKNSNTRKNQVFSISCYYFVNRFEEFSKTFFFLVSKNQVLLVIDL